MDPDGIILIGVLKGMTYSEIAAMGAGSAASSVQYRLESILIPDGFVARFGNPARSVEGKRLKHRARSLNLTQKGLAVLLDKQVDVPYGTPYMVWEEGDGERDHAHFRITRRRSRRGTATVQHTVEPGD